MVLHFTTGVTGLTAGDTEAFIKGRSTAAGQHFKLFGCDGMVTKP